MNGNVTLARTESPRRIDRTIGYFGEQRASAIRRTTWLTPVRRQKPVLPAVFLEHPLTMDSLRKLGA